MLKALQSSSNTALQKKLRIAVIDMGSNSFRLLLGYFEQGTFSQTDYIKETVRQGSLDQDGNITTDAYERGLECLARFKERLATENFDFIRAVATHTLREATNRLEFIADAEKILGFNIEVISGLEEARLIFSGVTHLLPPSNSYRTAIDIGGRSCEIVSGKGLEASEMESYSVGSVAVTQKYFPNQLISKEVFKHAKLGVIASLNHAENRFTRFIKFGEVWGCSGTIGAVYTILEAQLPEEKRLYEGAKCIDLAGMKLIRDQLLSVSNITDINIEGLKAERQPIFIGGFAVLDALFDLFDLKRVFVSDGALRHGVIYDVLERKEHLSDRRLRSILTLGHQFSVDAQQAEIVADTALYFYHSIQPTLREPIQQHPIENDQTLSQSDYAGSFEELLKYSALLHEVGGKISHTGIHRHGQYIVQNSNLVGFYESEQQQIAQLILASKGKLKTHADKFKYIDFVKQVLCLRLAIRLCHARRLPYWSAVVLTCNQANEFKLTVDTSWAEEHPQSFYLLEEEVQAFDKVGISLQLTTSNELKG